MQWSHNVRVNVANLSPLANLQCEIFATLVRVSHHSLETTCENMRLSGEKIKLSDIHTNVVQTFVPHSHECLATVVRIKIKIRYIRGKKTSVGCDIDFTYSSNMLKVSIAIGLRVNTSGFVVLS